MTCVTRFTQFFSAIVRIFRMVPMLPVVIAAAIPLALLGDWRPWSSVGEVASNTATAASFSGIPVLGNPGVGQWLIIVLVLVVVIDTVRGMINDIRHGQVGVDLLAVVAILSTVAVHEYWASWAVMLMIASGEAIEEYAQAKAEHSLTALVEAAPRTAHVITLPGVGRGDSGNQSGGQAHAGAHAARNIGPARGNDFRPVSTNAPVTSPSDNICAITGHAADDCLAVTDAIEQHRRAVASSHFVTLPVDDVRIGDVIIVLPGETVPVDGELLSGSATLDLSAINGEPMPREVFAGARVMSGAVNGATALTMRATETAADSQYQRILSLVSAAQESRPAVVRTADRLAVPFTILSLVIAGVAWAFSGVPTRFAQVLVLATPCPLLIAAPVAYIAGTGRLAAAGVLIKTQDVLEQLGRVTRVFFDKTGTLTVKQPQVVRVEMLPEVAPGDGASDGMPRRLDEDHVLMMAGVVEGYSTHILSRGIAKAGTEAAARLRARFASGQRSCPDIGADSAGAGARVGIHAGLGREYPVVKDVREDAGRGVSGVVDGHVVRVGRLSFAEAGEDGFQTATSSGEHGRNGSQRSDVVVNDSIIRSAASTGVRDGGEVRQSGSLHTRFGMLQPDEMASYVSVDGQLIARIVLRDVPRANAREALARLHAMGVLRLTMLTGDKRASAEIIAREVGIDEIHAELFPEDKVAAVRNAAGADGVAESAGADGADGSAASTDSLNASRSSRRSARPVTMMVGDGVNDAPVLAAADIGVAMTDGTSTAASESAQVVIMNDNIAAVPQAIAIARRTKRVMLQAVLLGLGLALVGMLAAAFNLIPVVVGAFLQEAIDVVSILWALTALIDRE
ncbi:ATPase [Bifidobacterium hapali]|uniref:ATPase n=1 Tax=Bifidobacterium hapali TaxID=1630172 RepID=A0A261G0M5_9BIFI|nr:ATPase [Bifidobacterium hapali]